MDPLLVLLIMLRLVYSDELEIVVFCFSEVFEFCKNAFYRLFGVSLCFIFNVCVIEVLLFSRQRSNKSGLATVLVCPFDYLHNNISFLIECS